MADDLQEVYTPQIQKQLRAADAEIKRLRDFIGIPGGMDWLAGDQVRKLLDAQSAADALATAVKELNHPQFCAGPHGGCLFCPVMSALAAYEKARGLK